MAHEASDFLPGDDHPGPVGSGQMTVQQLTWALIDDQISSDEFQLLDSMLLSDDAARNEYMDCVRLHTDLVAHFAKPVDRTTTGNPPVLGFLSEGVPPLDAQAMQQ
jgi:anti-sigma factor RsiW